MVAPGPGFLKSAWAHRAPSPVAAVFAPFGRENEVRAHIEYMLTQIIQVGVFCACAVSHFLANAFAARAWQSSNRSTSSPTTTTYFFGFVVSAGLEEAIVFGFPRRF